MLVLCVCSILPLLLPLAIVCVVGQCLFVRYGHGLAKVDLEEEVTGGALRENTRT